MDMLKKRKYGTLITRQRKEGVVQSEKTRKSSTRLRRTEQASDFLDSLPKTGETVTRSGSIFNKRLPVEYEVLLRLFDTTERVLTQREHRFAKTPHYFFDKLKEDVETEPEEGRKHKLTVEHFGLFNAVVPGAYLLQWVRRDTGKWDLAIARPDDIRHNLTLKRSHEFREALNARVVKYYNHWCRQNDIAKLNGKSNDVQPHLWHPDFDPNDPNVVPPLDLKAELQRDSTVFPTRPENKSKPMTVEDMLKLPQKYVPPSVRDAGEAVHRQQQVVPPLPPKLASVVLDGGSHEAHHPVSGVAESKNEITIPTDLQNLPGVVDVMQRVRARRLAREKSEGERLGPEEEFAQRRQPRLLKAIQDVLRSKGKHYAIEYHEAVKALVPRLGRNEVQIQDDLKLLVKQEPGIRIISHVTKKTLNIQGWRKKQL